MWFTTEIPTSTSVEIQSWWEQTNELQLMWETSRAMLLVSKELYEVISSNSLWTIYFGWTSGASWVVTIVIHGLLSKIVLFNLPNACAIYIQCFMSYNIIIYLSLHKKVTINQVTTMLATSINVLFPGHNYLLTTSIDDPTLWLSSKRQRVISTSG